MYASGNGSIYLGLCAREEHTNVTSISYFQKEEISRIINIRPNSIGTHG